MDWDEYIRGILIATNYSIYLLNKKTEDSAPNMYYITTSPTTESLSRLKLDLDTLIISNEEAFDDEELKKLYIQVVQYINVAKDKLKDSNEKYYN